MSISAIKRQSPPPDPLRTALAQAIENAGQARVAVDRHKAAGDKCRRAMWAAEKVHAIAAEAESFQVAFHRLREDLPLWQADADKAAAEVEGAVSAALAPYVEQFIARLRELMAEVRPYQSLVAGFLESHLVQTIGAEGQRPIASVLDAAMTYGTGDFAVTTAPWVAARAALKADPYANVDDLLALPASSPPPSAA